MKPFGSTPNHVQCLRCGEWGHKSVDRECKLRDFNPHGAAVVRVCGLSRGSLTTGGATADAARQLREDPMQYMTATIYDQKHQLVLKKSSLGHMMKAGEALVASDEEGACARRRVPRRGSRLATIHVLTCWARS